MSVPNFGPIEVQIWPPGGVSQKRKSAVSEVTMIARVTKLTVCVSSEVTLLTVWDLNLTSFSRSQRSKFKISLSGGTFPCYLT